jgi:protein-disulfide isomerase
MMAPLFKKTATTLFTILAIGSTATASASEVEMSQQKFNSMLMKAFQSNPELLIAGVESVRTYQTMKHKQMFSKSLYYDEDTPVLNEAGEITIVEFFDYACGVCKRGATELAPLIGKDKRIRFVYKDVSILGPNSTELAKIAIAVNQISPNAYPAFHKELLSMQQSIPQKAYELAELMGLDSTLIKKTANSSQVSAILNKNNKLFRDLKLTGTPTFYIGEKKFGGLISRQQVSEEVNLQYSQLVNQTNRQAVSK